MKVHALISLFRPITASVPTPAAPLPDVARSGSFRSPITEEEYHPTAKLCLQKGSYLPGVQCTHELPIYMQSKQVVRYPLYDKYEAETHVAHAQPPTEPRHVVQRASLPHHADSYYLAAEHEPYLPEQPFLSYQDAYRRCILLLHFCPITTFSRDFVVFYTFGGLYSVSSILLCKGDSFVSAFFFSFPKYSSINHTSFSCLNYSTG